MQCPLLVGVAHVESQGRGVTSADSGSITVVFHDHLRYYGRSERFGSHLAGVGSTAGEPCFQMQGIACSGHVIQLEGRRRGRRNDHLPVRVIVFDHQVSVHHLKGDRTGNAIIGRAAGSLAYRHVKVRRDLCTGWRHIRAVERAGRDLLNAGGDGLQSFIHVMQGKRNNGLGPCSRFGRRLGNTCVGIIQLDGVAVSGKMGRYLCVHRIESGVAGQLSRRKPFDLQFVYHRRERSGRQDVVFAATIGTVKDHTQRPYLSVRRDARKTQSVQVLGVFVRRNRFDRIAREPQNRIVKRPLLIGVVQIKMQYGGVAASRCDGVEREVFRLHSRETRYVGYSRLGSCRPSVEEDLPVMYRVGRGDDEILVQRRRCIERSRHRIDRINAGSVVANDQIAFGIDKIHVHLNHISGSAVTRQRHYRCRERVKLRFVGGDGELLLRFDHFGDRADGMELNIVQRKIVAYMQRIGVEVNHGYCHVVAVLVGIECLGVLVPYIVAVLRIAEVEDGGVPHIAVVFDAELEAGGIVHLAVVVDIRRPEREDIGRTFLENEVGIVGGIGAPCLFVTSFCAGHGVNEGEVSAFFRFDGSIGGIEIIRVLNDCKTVLFQSERVDVRRRVVIEIDLRSSGLVKIAPVVVFAHRSDRAVRAVFGIGIVFFVPSVRHHIIHGTGEGVVLLIYIGLGSGIAERGNGEVLRLPVVFFVFRAVHYPDVVIGSLRIGGDEYGIHAGQYLAGELLYRFGSVRNVDDDAFVARCVAREISVYGGRDSVCSCRGHIRQRESLGALRDGERDGVTVTFDDQFSVRFAESHYTVQRIGIVICVHIRNGGF